MVVEIPHITDREPARKPRALSVSSSSSESSSWSLVEPRCPTCAIKGAAGLDDIAQARELFEESVKEGEYVVALAWGEILMEIYRVNVFAKEAFKLRRELDGLRARII